MISLYFRRILPVVILFISVTTYISGQGTQVSWSSIPKSGTVMIYTHQDDDVIFMLPFWEITEKFIIGGMPSTPGFRQIIAEQQDFLDSAGYNIPYQQTWEPAWDDITDDEYGQYYLNQNQAYAYLKDTYLEARSASDGRPLDRSEVNKVKARLERFISSPSVSRIVTHNNWGEYGHEHHKVVNIAVRELAVKYRKDVWMLGCETGFFIDVPIPSGITYAMGYFNTPIYLGIRPIYTKYWYWTWPDKVPPDGSDNLDYRPTGYHPFIKIVEGGVDKSTIMTGESVTTSGALQGRTGAYILNGTNEYVALKGNKTTSFTIGMRIRPDEIKAMDISKMTEFPGSSSFDRSMYMRSDGKISGRIYDGQSRTVTSTSSLTAGNWAHVLITGNGSNLKLYINGILEGNISAGSAITSYVTPDLVLGHAQETTSYFKGQISDVVLYNYVLSDSEILALADDLVPNIYTITASAGSGGSIDPQGNVSVSQGTNKTFYITPNSGYEIQNVTVDGSSVGVQSSYTFYSVNSNHTIQAVFAPVTITNLTISGVTANNKVYDGTTSASLNAGSATLVGVLPGDEVTLVTSGATGAFTDKNAGTGKTVNTSGFTLTGTHAYKYTLTQPALSANITVLTVTGSFTVSNKVYDGNTNAGVLTRSLSGKIGSDNVNLTGGSASFNNKNIGSGKTVTLTGASLTGTDAGNYSLTGVSTTTANITARQLNVGGSFTVNNKVYDGTTPAVISANSLTLNTVVTGDVVTFTPVAEFINKTAGTGKIVNLSSGSSISGNDAGNYILSLTGAPSTTANITARQLTIGGSFGVNNKTYDGTTSAVISTNNLTLLTIIGGDVVNLNPVAVFSDKTAGTGKNVNLTAGTGLTGTDAGNYSLSLTGSPVTTANISVRQLTIGGSFTAGNKIYDGTTSAVIATNSLTLIAKITGDDVNLIPEIAFNNKNAGTGKQVSISAGSALAGADAGNYSLSLTGSPVTTANITAKSITIGGSFTTNNKVYDGTVTAVIASNNLALISIIAGDNVNLLAVPVFQSKDVGTGKNVSLSAGSSLAGADAGNYSLVVAGSPTTTASITAKTLTVGGGFTARNKIYDGTASAVIASNSLTLLTKEGNDDVSLIAMAGFSDKNSGNGKTVNLKPDSYLSGADAGNYILSIEGSPVTNADINVLELTIGGSFTVNHKIYDGDNTTVISSDNLTLNTVLEGDEVSLNAVAAFNNKIAGTNKVVRLTGSVLTGSDASNYSISFTGSPTTTANITVKEISVGGEFSVHNKVYDRTVSAVINSNHLTLVTKVDNDDVNLVPVAAFAEKSTGTGKPVILTGGTHLTGADAENYSLSLSGAPSTFANITPRQLTIGGTFTVQNKVYNGTTVALISVNNLVLNTVITGDVVSLNAIAGFTDKNVGTGKLVTLAGSEIAGSDASNYSLSFAGSPVATANISAKQLTIGGTFTAADKVYDGTTESVLTVNNLVLNSVLTGDMVSLNPVAIFADKVAGIDKTVSLAPSSSLSGEDAENYTLSFTGAPVSKATIMPKELRVGGSFTAQNKIYDGTPSASISLSNLTLNTVVTGDNVSLNTVAAFADKTAGNGKMVSLDDASALSGSDAVNYSLSLTGSPVAFANISTRALTIGGSFTSIDKEYDGTTEAELVANHLTLNTIINGDDVDLNAVAVFATRDVRMGKEVSLIASTLTGNDAPNYRLSFTGSPTTIASISARQLTIAGSFTVADKVYDGTTGAVITTNNLTLHTVLPGDLVNLNLIPLFTDKNAGTGKVVNLAGSSLTGADAKNYSLSFEESPTTTADIAIKEVTIGGIFTAGNKIYDGTTSAMISVNNLVLNTVAAGDAVILQAIAEFEDRYAGSGKQVGLAGSFLEGLDAMNYSLSVSGSPVTTAAITARELFITGTFTATDKMYDGTVNAEIEINNLDLNSIAGDDEVNFVPIAVFSNKSAGNGKTVFLTTGSSLTGTDAVNYSLSLTGSPVATANITPQELNIGGSFTAGNKMYDGSADAVIITNNLTLNTIIEGDIVNFNALATFNNKSAGSGKLVSLSGSFLSGIDALNYNLSLNGSPSATADITPKSVIIGGTFTAGNKVYDGTTTAVIVTNNLTVNTIIENDLVELRPVAEFSDKNSGTAKSVNLLRSTLTGLDATNYMLSVATSPTSVADIMTRELTIGGSFTVTDKDFDGNTSATILINNLTINTVVGSDDIMLNAIAEFDDGELGYNKQVNLTGSFLSGSAASNYTLSLSGAPVTSASITEYILRILGVNAENKEYDGTTEVTVNIEDAYLSGIKNSDAVILVNGEIEALFSDKHAGTDKLVIINGFSVEGPDAEKYTLVQPIVRADITPRELTVTGIVTKNKVYDGETDAVVELENLSVSGILETDEVILETDLAAGFFEDKNVGSSKMVYFTGFMLNGADGGNYSLELSTATADITSAALTVSGLTAQNKIYDGTNTAILDLENIYLDGIFGNDDVNLLLSGITGFFDEKDAGPDKTVITSGLTLEGSDAFNYTLILPALTATISPKPLQIIANSVSKDYGTLLSFEGNEYTAVGLIDGDMIAGLVITSEGAGISAPVGEYEIIISEGINHNYSISYDNGSLTVNKALLTAKAADKTRFYGSENPVLSISYNGFANGDDESVLNEIPVLSTPALVTSLPGLYDITITGGADDNYELVLETGMLEIEKAPLTITAENKTRVYGHDNPALTFVYSGFVLDQDEDVLESKPVIATSATKNSNAGNYDIITSGAMADNYNTIHVKGILTITRAHQMITVFEKIPADIRMMQEYMLHATSTSGLPITYQVSDPSKAIVNGNKLKLQKDGIVIVTARQDGDQNWNPASAVSQTIHILPTFDHINSLFTPNQDGVNDYWYIPDLEEYGVVQVTVYNRFGKLVYQSERYQNDWDGTWNGYELPSASYYYIMKSSVKGVLTGVVNIVR